MTITSEDAKATGRLGGLKSVEVKRQRAAARQADPLYDVKRNLGKHFLALEAAASGQGVWKDLPLPARLSALLKVIEYGVGKPVGVDKQQPKDEGGSAAEGGGREAAGTVSFE